MDSLLDFSGQVAMITGAASGFGRLLSQGLAARGCNLVISDINSEELANTVSSLKLGENKVISMLCDVSKEDQVKAMVDAAIENFGRLDIGVNNAGIAHHLTPLHKIDQATMDSQMAVNVNGVLFGMKYQIEAMLKQGSGHILNLSSMAGIGGAPKGAAYAAAKHAVVGLTRTAAVEYAKKGIRANAICPFYSPTNILALDGFDSPENQQRLAQGSPMRRLGQPQEIVNTMILILSPGNSYMSGQTIAIDGAVSAW
ncbi:glucose 1-dehydrogenase [Aliiglaciecola sp. 2_MG-2023]|uniref:SDR family NAD(P)-dependent oxidoreductase n=1 Tax=Alteromonadaceae TaxID=72275 RepID=UPI0026E42C95|nr:MULTISPECIES: glucose 1-dehydrogenase [unclassified Aliiglaciecola]MDO6710213.1 glucose 1-dehydrogenase [Aliiglaciecola sp. 2_MG-2023]MDO6751361.1 glucose 1-dehydrogenase [Aliiglaciecola sp. 1_MG-2023]